MKVIIIQLILGIIGVMCVVGGIYLFVQGWSGLSEKWCEAEIVSSTYCRMVYPELLSEGQGIK